MYSNLRRDADMMWLLLSPASSRQFKHPLSLAGKSAPAEGKIRPICGEIRGV
jgi:hypothetical protein